MGSVTKCNVNSTWIHDLECDLISLSQPDRYIFMVV